LPRVWGGKKKKREAQIRRQERGDGAAGRKNQGDLTSSREEKKKSWYKKCAEGSSLPPKGEKKPGKREKKKKPRVKGEKKAPVQEKKGASKREGEKKKKLATQAGSRGGPFPKGEKDRCGAHKGGKPVSSQRKTYRKRGKPHFLEKRERPKWKKVKKKTTTCEFSEGEREKKKNRHDSPLTNKGEKRDSVQEREKKTRGGRGLVGNFAGKEKKRPETEENDQKEKKKELKTGPSKKGGAKEGAVRLCTMEKKKKKRPSWIPQKRKKKNCSRSTMTFEGKKSRKRAAKRVPWKKSVLQGKKRGPGGKGGKRTLRRKETLTLPRGSEAGGKRRKGASEKKVKSEGGKEGAAGIGKGQNLHSKGGERGKIPRNKRTFAEGGEGKQRS